MAYEQILYERRGRVVLITLNRPDSLNATTSVMNAELQDAFNTAGADHTVGCVVITGAGRAFCAGADVRAFQEGLRGGEGYRAQHGPGGRLDTLWQIPKPVVAAINGVAVGVGATMPLACDLRVASDAARIGYTFRRLGMAPEFGSTFLLPRVVGLSRAMELCMTGRMVDAAEALQLGLVTSVFPHATFIDEVMTLATDLADGPTQALGMTKEGFHRALTTTLAEAEAWEYTTANPALRAGPEYREGVAAFAEKRAPKFHGDG
ncbi:MAG: enoyl-CoA hydratase/isomerase family protein [Dehalococcoidia bacterium]